MIYVWTLDAYKINVEIERTAYSNSCMNGGNITGQSLIACHHKRYRECCRSRLRTAMTESIFVSQQQCRRFALSFRRKKVGSSYRADLHLHYSSIFTPDVFVPAFIAGLRARSLSPQRRRRHYKNRPKTLRILCTVGIGLGV